MGLSGIQDWIDNEFQPKFTAFSAAVDDWRDDAERTKVKMIRLKDSEAAFIPVYRTLYNGFLKRNPLVSDADLAAMGLPNRYRGSYAPVGIPSTYPEVEVDSSVLRRLTLHFHDWGSIHKAKPAGVHGARICWAILDAPPRDADDLLQSSFATHSPFMLEFHEPQRGNTLYFVLCWENTRGEKGMWGEIGHAIIP
jgi:hypothetical protein